MSRSAVAQPARACTEVELGKYKAMMTQEEAMAAEDATRASRVQDWVQALEEVPPEVLKDAREQQRAYLERLSQTGGSSRTGSRRVSKEGGSSEQNTNNNNNAQNAVKTPDDRMASPEAKDGTSKDASETDMNNMKSTMQQHGSKGKEGMNAMLSCMSEGKQSQDQEIVAQDHASEEGGRRRSRSLNRDGQQSGPDAFELEEERRKGREKTLTCAERDAAEVVAGELRQKLVQAGVYEAFMQVRLCMNNGKNLRKEFETIDVDRDQVISMNEFLFACYAMGTGLRRQQIEAIFRVIDNNNNGVVEPEEFIAAFQAPPAEGRTTSTNAGCGSVEGDEETKSAASPGFARCRRASAGEAEHFVSNGKPGGEGVAADNRRNSEGTAAEPASNSSLNRSGTGNNLNGPGTLPALPGQPASAQPVAAA